MLFQLQNLLPLAVKEAFKVASERMTSAAAAASPPLRRSSEPRVYTEAVLETAQLSDEFKRLGCTVDPINGASFVVTNDRRSAVFRVHVGTSVMTLTWISDGRALSCIVSKTLSGVACAANYIPEDSQSKRDLLATKTSVTFGAQ